MPFQQIDKLPTRSSLTLGDTRYTPPDVLTSMPFFSGAVALDNFGGHDDDGRLASAIDLHGLLGQDDLLSLRSLGSAEQGHYHWAAYQRDVGPWSSRLGVVFSDMAYKLGDELKLLDAKGKTRTSSAFLMQPLLENDPFTLRALLQYDEKHLDDEIGILVMRSEKRSRVVHYTLSGELREPSLLAAVTSFSVSWSEGHLNIDGSPYTLVGRADAGRFEILRAHLAHLQPLGGKLALYASVQGQWTDDNLDDSEMLYIGGAFGVRSSEQTAAFGDRGWLGSLELRYALTDTWQLVAFADHGEARLNTASLVFDTAPRRLSGQGLGMKWASARWSFTTLAGWRVGDAPEDSKTEHTPRLWSQLAYAF